MIKDAELALELQKFLSKNRNNKYIWSKTKTGRILKNEINKRGNWKNAPRGDPRKGQRIMRENKEKSE